MWLLTLKSVLVATDLGEASRPAIRTAARLADLAGAKLHLLHVSDAPMDDGEALLREEFERVAPGAHAAGTVQVVLGSPARAIVRQAVRLGADAIILGPHRKGGGEEASMGSTAASVVSTAPCPCLVVARELRLPLERVIAPVDLSEVANGALSVALSWASALRPRGGEARLTVLQVTPSPVDPTAGARVHAEVERARARAGGGAHVAIGEQVVPGADPVAEILRHADTGDADLLVMGTHGAAGAASGFGSVSAAVARSTPCPLLLVPPAAWKARGDPGV